MRILAFSIKSGINLAVAALAVINRMGRQRGHVMMQRRYALTVILFLALALFATGAATTAPTTYTDPQNRFSIAVLDGFGQVTSPPPPMAVSYTAAQLPGTGYNVQIEDESKDIGPRGTLDDLAPFVVQAAQGLANHDPVPGPDTIQATTLGGQDARRYDSVATFAGLRIRLSVVYTLIGTTAYSVTFNTRDSDFASLDPQRQAVLDSFMVLPGARSPQPVMPTATAAPTARVVTDPNGRFSFTLPANYRQVGPNETFPGAWLRIGTPLLGFTSTTTTGANIIISSEQITPTGNPRLLDDGVAMLRSQLPQASDQITMGTDPIQSFTLGGQDARSYDFFYTTPQLQAHGVQVITLVGNTVYYLTFIAPEANNDVLQRDRQSVVSSFAFLPGA